MAEYPLLMFPRPAEVDRSGRSGGGRGVRKPTAAEQRRRLSARFRRIANSFQSIQAGVQGIVPEQVIVLETIGDSVEGLAASAAKIDGLEWLVEMDLDDVAPVAGFAIGDDPAAYLSCRLYAMMSNQRAMQELLTLWDRWTESPQQRAERGFGPFKNLFINLRDVRRWDVQDRLAATGVLPYLRERLEDEDGEIQFEVELWCRQEQVQREAAYRRLRELIEETGGQCVTQFALPAIMYHGALVSMAARKAQALIDEIARQRYSALVRCEDVMFFRPHGQAAIPNQAPGEPEPRLATRMQSKPIPQEPPVLVVLDGLPLERHVALRGRLTIDDPDEYGERYEAAEQQHGTAIASLAIHGELEQDEPSLASRVYCRPILAPVRLPNKSIELVPDRELLVDLIFRAVRRIMEGDDGQPVAPTIRVINLSIGDPYRPFDCDMSPLARLLDWLAWKYRVLFVVSAGNQLRDITLGISMDEWNALAPERRPAETLQALYRDQATRRNYSPSESLNAITVGVVHADASESRLGDRRTDLLDGGRLPSPIATICNGFRRSVKPDILAPGGRQLYDVDMTRAGSEPASFHVTEGVAPPGQQVALPGARPMELDRTGYTRGSSNAAAIASRIAVRIHERLTDLAATSGGEALASADMAVVLKCLLAHGADWGLAAEAIDGIFREMADGLANGNKRKVWRIMEGIKSRFLGFGEVVPDRSLFCTDERVTLLGWGSLRKDNAHRFDLPLPDALSGQRVRRKLTVTLAWHTPVNFRHQKYRQSQLWFTVDDGAVGTNNDGLSYQPAQRGTVEHRVFVGTRAIALDDDTLSIQVNCREDAGGLSDEVPYALATTLEAAQPLAVSVHEQVAQQLRARVRIEGP